MRRVQGTKRRVVAGIALMLLAAAPLVAIAPPAEAFPKGDSVIGFAYKIRATTHIKKLNQTISPPPGTFKGQIDIELQRLQGSITLPPATFTLQQAGLPLATGMPVNLVGNSCTTATPVSVTMTGIASLTKASKFSGTFTIPNFKNCGLATAALNQLIPGPGNTFTANATPQ